MTNADINFYFDPLCPFAWMTSRWVRQVAAQRDYTVDWRFISLRMINVGVDYDSHFPAGYEAGHIAGLRLLRVAARTRAEHGRRAVGSLYEAIGTQAFDSAGPGAEELGSRELTGPLLERAGLPAGLAAALEDASWGRRTARGNRRGARADRQGCRHPLFSGTLPRRGLSHSGW